MSAAEGWIDLLLRRGPELRRAGILSIGVDGMSAVLAPAEPGDDDAADKEKGDDWRAEAEEPSSAWENPASYPTGIVPELPRDKDLPAIPTFPGEG